MTWRGAVETVAGFTVAGIVWFAVMWFVDFVDRPNGRHPR